MGLIRAFVGLDVPHEVRARLNVVQFLLPLPRQVDPDSFHLTLTFLGEQPDDVLVAVDEGLQAIRQEPFTLLLQGIGLFGGGKPRAAWAGAAPSEPLDRLQAKCDRIARGAGVTVERRRFVPHVTLGRFSPPPPEDTLKLERAVAAEGLFRAGPWEVTDLCLFRSWLHRDGAEYEVLARYPLG